MLGLTEKAALHLQRGLEDLCIMYVPSGNAGDYFKHSWLIDLWPHRGR